MSKSDSFRYDSKEFAKRLSDLIKEKFGSRQKFSEVSDIPQPTIESHCNPKNSKQAPKADSLALYSQFLGVSTDYLIFGKDCTASSPSDPFRQTVDCVTFLIEKYGRIAKVSDPALSRYDIPFGSDVYLTIKSASLSKYVIELYKVLDLRDTLESIDAFDVAIEKTKQNAVKYENDMNDYWSKKEGSDTNG